MNKTLCLYMLLFTTILPVFSTNTMDQNGNSNSQHSNTVNSNQQANDLAVNQSSTQKNRGLIEGALRYAYKTMGAYDIQKELVGLRSEKERNDSLEIFRQYSLAIEDRLKTVDHVLQKQLVTRRDYATELTEKYIQIFKKNESDEQDIVDASTILRLEQLDFLVPAGLVKMLRTLVDEATEKQINNLTTLREAIKPPQPKSVKNSVVSPQQPAAEQIEKPTSEETKKS